VHQVPYLAFTSSQKESKFPAHNGLFGGYSMTVVPGIRVLESSLLEQMAAGEPDLPVDDYTLASGSTALRGEVIVEHQTRGIRVLKRGEILAASTQGSGGYGDVLEREPEQVMQDLRADAISDWTAANVYRVAYDAETLIPDLEATRRAREEQRAQRLAHGRPYAEFAADWEQRRPPDEAIKYFGEWPSGAPNRDVVRI
jgi:acetophenone carboxylase